MKWIDPNAVGYSPFKPERSETRPFPFLRTIGVDKEALFNLLRQTSEEAFEEIAEWAFLFYAKNDNWRKFPSLQP